MQTPKWFSPVLLMMGFLLAGCGRVEDLAGVELATASPTATRPPSEIALPLPRIATKDFLGTVITMNYPDGWQTDEGGQSITLFDPTTAGSGGTGVGLFVALTRTIGITEAEDEMAGIVMSRYLGRGAEAGFVNQEAAPDEGETLAFTWGTHDAAIFRWESEDGSTIGVQVLVLDDDKRRFVILGTTSSPDRWPDFQATWLDMMSTFTLNGTPLPLASLQAAFQTITG